MKFVEWLIWLCMLVFSIWGAIHDALAIELILGMYGTAAAILIFCVYMLIIGYLSKIVFSGIES